MLNRRQLLVVAAGKAALHYASAIAEERDVTRRTARVPVGGNPEEVEYDVIGDMRGGMKGRIAGVIFDGLFGTGDKFRHSEVRNAMGDDIVCLALRNNFKQKRNVMDSARMAKAVLDADQDFRDSQNIALLGVSAGGLNALTMTTLLKGRAKICMLLSAQGDLADPRYARLTPRGDLSRLKTVCANSKGSSLRETALRSAAMAFIRGMSQDPERMLEQCLQKLPERDVTLIMNDPELMKLLLEEFAFYCAGAPSGEEGKTLGHLRIENSIRSLFGRGVPWEDIPQETVFSLWHYEEDSLVDSRNSTLIKKDLEEKSGNRRTEEVHMLPGNSHFGYFEKNGPLPAIVEAMKKGMR